MSEELIESVYQRLRQAERERDQARAKIAALTSALERTETNFRSAVRGVPVRDMDENLAENRAALADENGAEQ